MPQQIDLVRSQASEGCIGSTHQGRRLKHFENSIQYTDSPCKGNTVLLTSRKVDTLLTDLRLVPTRKHLQEQGFCRKQAQVPLVQFTSRWEARNSGGNPALSGMEADDLHVLALTSRSGSKPQTRMVSLYKAASYLRPNKTLSRRVMFWIQGSWLV